VSQAAISLGNAHLYFVGSHPNAWMTPVHRKDREATSMVFWDGVDSGQGFATEPALSARRTTADVSNKLWSCAMPKEGCEIHRYITTALDNPKRVGDALRGRAILYKYNQ
jgi:hypothetical protein